MKSRSHFESALADPGYGTDYEGHKGELLLKEAVYRIDAKTGQMAMVTD